jgi:hypothetical protein
MSFQTTSSRIGERAQQAGLFVVGLALLLITWLLIYVSIGSFTQGWLNSWGDGTWQSRLLPVLLPENLALVISLLLLVFRLMRDRDRAWIPLEFATLNLLFIIAFMVVGIILILPSKPWLSQPLSPDVGYQRIWPEGIVGVCTLLILFVAQARGWLRRWLPRGGAVRGGIIGVSSGAMLFAGWAVLVALLQDDRVFVMAVGGVMGGAVIGLVAGAIAGASSRLSVALISGAITGAVIGWIYAGDLPWPLIGAMVGLVVGVIVGSE